MTFSFYFICSMLLSIHLGVIHALNFVRLISFVVVLIMEDHQVWLVLTAQLNVTHTYLKLVK